MRSLHFAIPLLLALTGAARAAEPPDPALATLFPDDPETPEEVVQVLREHYTKHEVRIPMRDGARLFTSIYAPKDRSRPYPFLLERTPYSVAPYGVDNYVTTNDKHAIKDFVPAPQLLKYGFIIVHQDVRGRMMSEGTYVDIRPVNPNKKGPADIDETTDTWDTVDWLVKNVPNNNGRAGVFGISYPGFYAAQAVIDAHPAVRAVSPQAPVTDWFVGDDFHHNGAFFLADAFLFYVDFGRPRPAPVNKWKWEFDTETGDVYDFFLRLGPLANADNNYMKGDIGFWRDLMQHPARDAFWQARDPRPHMRKVRPAVMTVGGWYDAEDLFGALATYRAIETQGPAGENTLVMGPWPHGGWLRGDGEGLGDMTFGAKTSDHYREKIITPFFLRHLKGAREGRAPEAQIFETGTDQWQRHDVWPPREARPVSLFFQPRGRLGTAAPAAGGDDRDVYTSDPSKPVPYRDRMSPGRDRDYMIEDQRFAARRPDVLVYATEPLADDVALAGPIEADLWISTTGTDADFVVKVIDAYPEDARDPEPNPKLVRMGGYQRLVRAEVMRARFRNSYEKPEPLVPERVERVRFTLPDVAHAFRAGHRLMVQVQSTWFPLVDRNPQTYVDIYRARAEDFHTATHTIHRAPGRASGIKVMVLRGRL